MRSTSDGVARPVRTVANCDCVWATALSILSIASSSVSSITVTSVPRPVAPNGTPGHPEVSELVDERPLHAALDDVAQRPLLRHVEDHDRNAVVATEGDRRGIHHLEVLGHDFEI